MDADEPAILAGGDQGANPVEHLLHALASCLTTSIVAHAAVRGIEIEELESELEGDIDLNGFLGLDAEMPKGFTEIRARFRVKADPKDMDNIKRLAQTDSTILMTGETGTGKSFLSGNVHYNSPRRAKPFVKVNCANIPETLLESELFGHEKGAFTGADKTRTGRFEQADKGTLFLDEFCELGFDLQAKLLRALEEKAFERLGGSKTISVDTRIIAATNRDIEALVREGKFREDLYYRVNVLRIHMPPLRDRTECIEPLAYLMLDRLSRAAKKRVDTLSPEVLVMLKTYPWRGNIRELSNAIERAIFLADSSEIGATHISIPQISKMPASPAPTKHLRLSDEEERQMIFRALEKNLWIQKDAARELGLSPRALNYRIQKHGITHDRWRKNK
jgi:two-component system response regulator AtoC